MFMSEDKFGHCSLGDGNRW